MRSRIVAVVALLLLVCSMHAIEAPAAAIAKAKTEITAGNHAAALRLLHEATAGAASMTDLRQRSAALSAIHFYSALAASGLGDKEQATNELRSFMLYGSGSKLDVSRYPKEFATLFNETQRNVQRGRDNPASFDDAYPGFPPAVSSSAWPLDVWGASSEFLILATAEEKKEWDRLPDSESRRKFVDAFWIARDPDPATRVNEARIEMLHRIAFADVAFDEAADDRGSLTDRGRVFVLLGPPRRVTIRPLDRREAPWAPRRTIDVGNAMEQWTYFREELPKKLPHNEVVFR
ncbi:MAG TPA: GWxTD domain-containing protein, partial [Thermoanaerobaculia bacterium]|nr:GWxTD domain-containing protein [Thermoanaerobaculia bacterium]